jgi:hypothetical protein
MKRTRKVFPTSQIAHLWASSDLTEARNAQGNLFFTTEANGDRCLWSYGRHYLVGRITTAPNGERVVLLTESRRSVTTSRHQAEARAAVRHLTRFTVGDADSDPRDLMGSYQLRYDVTMKRAATAKEDGNRPYHLADAARVLDEARAFAAAFGLPDTMTERDLATLATDAAERRKALAARTRDTTERMGLALDAMTAHAATVADPFTLNAHARELAMALAKIPKKERKAHADKAAAEWAVEFKRRRAEEEAKARAALTEWRAKGGNVYHLRNAPPALRVNGEEVETSWGAAFPLTHAAPLWRAIQTAKASGGRTFNRAEDSSPKAGHFTVESITAEGDVIAGCHRVPFEECERLARDLGLTEPGAEAMRALDRKDRGLTS